MDPVFKPGGGPDASPPLPKIVVGKKLSRRRKGINPAIWRCSRSTWRPGGLGCPLRSRDGRPSP